MRVNAKVEAVSLVGKGTDEIYQHVALQKLSQDYFLARSMSPESYESLKTAIAHLELMALSCVVTAVNKDKELFFKASETLKSLIEHHIAQSLEILNGQNQPKEKML